MERDKKIERGLEMEGKEWKVASKIDLHHPFVRYVRSRESIDNSTGGCPDGAGFEEDKSSLCV